MEIQERLVLIANENMWITSLNPDGNGFKVFTKLLELSNPLSKDEWVEVTENEAKTYISEHLDVYIGTPVLDEIDLSVYDDREIIETGSNEEYAAELRAQEEAERLAALSGETENVETVEE